MWGKKTVIYICAVCVMDHDIVFVSLVQYMVCVSFSFMFVPLYLVLIQVRLWSVLVHFVTGVVPLRFVEVRRVVGRSSSGDCGVLCCVCVRWCTVVHTTFAFPWEHGCRRCSRVVSSVLPFIFLP